MTADWIARFASQFFQLQPRCPGMTGKRRVMVQRYLNGELHFRYQELEFSYTVLPTPPLKSKGGLRWRNRKSTCRRKITPGGGPCSQGSFITGFLKHCSDANDFAIQLSQSRGHFYRGMTTEEMASGRLVPPGIESGIRKLAPGINAL